MIKLSINPNKNVHEDILMTIEAMPNYTKIADSYYLYDFLELSNEELEKMGLKDKKLLEYGLIQFINYWIECMKTLQIGHKKFIPFDLSDEYVAGLLIQKTASTIALKIVYTSMIQGFSINKSTLDKEIETNKIVFENEVDTLWTMTEIELIQGLEQSITEMIKQ